MTLLAWDRQPHLGRKGVVLLHGWAQDAGCWEGWVSALDDAGLAALACDLPGHRGSAGFDIPSGVDAGAWAAQAVALDLATMRVQEPHVVAFAEGGLVAVQLAIAGIGDRVVLIDPDVVGRPRVMREAAAALRHDQARLWTPEASELVARARAGRGHDHGVLASWLEQASWPAPARLASIRRPVLIAVGSSGPHRERAPGLAALFRNGQVATIREPTGSPGMQEMIVRYLTESRR